MRSKKVKRSLLALTPELGATLEIRGKSQCETEFRMKRKGGSFGSEMVIGVYTLAKEHKKL